MEATNYPDGKVHGANMGPIWGRQDPGGPHVGPMNPLPSLLFLSLFFLSIKGSIKLCQPELPIQYIAVKSHQLIFAENT